MKTFSITSDDDGYEVSKKLVKIFGLSDLQDIVDYLQDIIDEELNESYPEEEHDDEVDTDPEEEED